MRGIRAIPALGAILLLGIGPAAAWSYLDEVTLLDPSVSAQMDFEMPVAKSYCESSPPNLDRMACTLSPIDDFWFGTDAAGNRYGVVVTTDPNGEYFEVMRRPPGVQASQPVLRITKRTEPVFGEVTKLQISGTWTVDAANGALTMTFRGQCLDADCVAQSDDLEHLGTIRVTGLPDLFSVASTYQPPSSVSFRVPAVPFGLPAGSRMDVYTGALGTLPDLALSQPLLCDAAAGASPGQTVVVNDPLPDPAPGTGRYYLTTVTAGADRRAGRRYDGSGLVGRDPTGLPPCS